MSVDVRPYRRHGKLTGTCLCGSVEMHVDGRYLAAIGVCHCGMCQTWNGTVFGCFQADAQGVRVTGAVGRYASSHIAERAFCKICGTQLWIRNTAPDSAYEFMPGPFPAAAEFPLISEIYVDCAPAYGRMAGDHYTATRATWEAENEHVKGETP
jgi:hypothetical protein